jgi:hypothetical protein
MIFQVVALGGQVAITGIYAEITPEGLEGGF